MIYPSILASEKLYSICFKVTFQETSSHSNLCQSSFPLSFCTFSSYTEQIVSPTPTKILSQSLHVGINFHASSYKYLIGIVSICNWLIVHLFYFSELSKEYPQKKVKALMMYLVSLTFWDIHIFNYLLSKSIKSTTEEETVPNDSPDKKKAKSLQTGEFWSFDVSR